MINIVIPMAGHGSRFTQAGFNLPKPLIPVLNKPMIQWVIENLTVNFPHHFVFMCQSIHLKQYPELELLLRSSARNCTIISIDDVTEGAACTVLLAEHIINNTAPLMIANCDQYVDTNVNEYLIHSANRVIDGMIMTMKSDHPKWSYAKIDKNGMVTEVAEKKVISEEATVGIYNFKHGADFVAAAKKMIAKNLRVNNEFYVAPVYNELIALGKNIGTYNIGSVEEKMHGLGTPEDLNIFVNNFKIQST